MAKTQTAVETLSFETALAELEAIVQAVGGRQIAGEDPLDHRGPLAGDRVVAVIDVVDGERVRQERDQEVEGDLARRHDPRVGDLEEGLGPERVVEQLHVDRGIERRRGLRPGGRGQPPDPERERTDGRDPPEAHRR